MQLYICVKTLVIQYKYTSKYVSSLAAYTGIRGNILRRKVFAANLQLSVQRTRGYILVVLEVEANR